MDKIGFLGGSNNRESACNAGDPDSIPGPRRSPGKWKVSPFQYSCLSPLDCRRSNQSIVKEINSEYSLEGLMVKLKLQYFGRLLQRAKSLKKSQVTEKDPDARKDWGQEEKLMAEDEMVVWHHWLKGHEFEHTLGDNEG